LGLLAPQVWARDPADVGKRARRTQLPISPKASQQGLHSLDAVYTAHDCGPTTRLVRVGDREADVYDVWAAPRPAGGDLLMRAAWARGVQGAERSVWAPGTAHPVGAPLQWKVPRRGPQAARDATLALRFWPVTLRPPRQRQREGLPVVTLWAVPVQEVEPPADGTPIAWLLLPTVAVDTVDAATHCGQWYAWRWGMEVGHRILQSGWRLAARQRASGERWQRCLTL